MRKSRERVNVFPGAFWDNAARTDSFRLAYCLDGRYSLWRNMMTPLSRRIGNCALAIRNGLFKS
jgi:hypothetical protein